MWFASSLDVMVYFKFKQMFQMIRNNEECVEVAEWIESLVLLHSQATSPFNVSKILNNLE